MLDHLRAEGFTRVRGRRRAEPARGEIELDKKFKQHDRGGGGQPGDAARAAHAPDPVDRDGAQLAEGWSRSTSLDGEPMTFSENLSPRARRRSAGARAARLLLQLPARRLPALHRARRAAGDRPRAGRARSDALDQRGGDRALAGRPQRLLRGIIQGVAEQLRDRSRDALAGALRARARPRPERDEGRAHPRQLPQPDGLPALLHDLVRGRTQQPGPALPRDRLRRLAREDRGVHEPAPLPGLPRRAAQARGAGGDDRRQGHPRVHGDVGDAGASLSDGARAVRDRAPDRRAHHPRDHARG